MSRIKPESLPKPKKVSKTQAKSLYTQFTSTGNSKYDVYVEAARGLKPGEALAVMVLPENVITSIQKKFRERGLTTAKGFYAVSKSLGSEEKGKKSLLIGRHATRPATKRKATSTRKSTKVSRTSRSKAATNSKAVKASRSKKAVKSVAKKSTSTATSKRKAPAKAKTRRNGVATSAA